MRSLLSILAITWALMSSLHACWRTPPEIEWQEHEPSSQVLKIYNRLGLIEVYQLSDTATALWSAEPVDFSDIFSVFEFTPDGSGLFIIWEIMA